MNALLIDGNDSHRRSLTNLLESLGFGVIALSARDELDDVDSGAEIPMAIVDIDAGMEVLEHPILKDALEIILMADEDDHVRVNQGISLGATYFFCRPFKESFIRDLARDIAGEAEAAGEKANDTNVACIEQFGLLRGDAPAIRRMYRTMRKVSPLDTTVFVIGESGTGKDLVAQTLHMMSARADEDFVAVNCASIPRELFESELFGHEKGSFSGAVSQHAGFFERAHNGTLFLDEITEIPVELQAKLLRVLETGKFRRVGGERDIETDVRIIASSNRRPEEAINDDKLRQDLYFRLARFQISIPPLRQRGNDIGGLAHFFLDELNQRYGGSKAITQDAIDLMNSYPWPGNVRELRSVIERAYILTAGEIGVADLQELEDAPEIPGDRIEISKGATIAEAEKKLILAVLDDHEGNKSKAAESLGISLKTLYNRLNEYNLAADS